MIEAFLNYLRYEQNRSPLTIENYRRDLKIFRRYFIRLDADLSWKTVDGDVIRGWMERMMDEGHSATSVNRRLSALRSFFRFAMSRNLVKHDPAHNITGPKKEKPLPQFLKESEMDTLVDDMPWGADFVSLRARTIIITFYETGMRLAELMGLDVNDVDFVKRQIKVTGKRDKQRIIPFGDELESTLRDYLKGREGVATVDDALFVTKKGERMNRDQIRYDVKKNLSRVSTLKKRTPHVLRHTFATAMLNHDAGIENVKKLLGHESLKTTEIYTHTTFEQLKRVYKQAHPRA